MSTVEATEPKTNNTGLAKAEQKHAPAPVLAGARGLELRTLEDYFRFAQYVISAGFAPKGVDTPAAVLVALQMGAELGLTPMASLQNIAVINNRPAVWGDAMLAVCQSSGAFDEEAFEERIETVADAITATCTVRRLPRGKPIVRTFSMSDAKVAGLAGKTGPWSQYPRRMLQMRARSWALRDGFADILRGFRCAEEAYDDEAIDVQSRPISPNRNARVRKSDLAEQERGSGGAGEGAKQRPEARSQKSGQKSAVRSQKSADGGNDACASTSDLRPLTSGPDLRPPTSASPSSQAPPIPSRVAVIQREIADAVTLVRLNEIDQREQDATVAGWCHARREQIRATRGGKSKQESLNLGEGAS